MKHNAQGRAVAAAPPSRRQFLKRGAFFIPAALAFPHIVRADRFPPGPLVSSKRPAASGGSCAGTRTAFATAADGTGGSFNNATLGLGFVFTVGAADIVVKSLGRLKFSGDTGTHAVHIREGDGTLVCTANVDMTCGSVGAWSYTDLAIAATLTATGSYYIFSDETDGGDSWYSGFFGNTITHTAVATVGDAAYWDGSVHTIGGGGNKAYSGPSFKYTSP